MPSISDQMLDSGCAQHIERIHAEPILIMSGPDEGKTFFAVRETEQDIVLNSDLGEDRRAKRILRFRDSAGVPNITSQTRLRTDDGKIWTAVRNPGEGYLSTDFELSEIVQGKDQ